MGSKCRGVLRSRVTDLQNVVRQRNKNMWSTLATRNAKDGLKEPLLRKSAAAGAAGVNPLQRDEQQAAIIRQHLQSPMGAAQHNCPAPMVSMPSDATSEIEGQVSRARQSFLREFTPGTAERLTSMAMTKETTMSEILQAVPIKPPQADGKTESLELGAAEGSPRRQAAHDILLAFPVPQESEALASTQELQRRPSGEVVRPATLLFQPEGAAGGVCEPEEEKARDFIKDLEGQSSSQDAKAMETRDGSEEQGRQMEASPRAAGAPKPAADALKPASQLVKTGGVKAALMKYEASREALQPAPSGAVVHNAELHPQAQHKAAAMQQQQKLEAPSAAPALET